MVVVAMLELAMAVDVFVLRPLLTRGDPRGVIRVGVIGATFALVSRIRLRPDGGEEPATNSGGGDVPASNAEPRPPVMAPGAGLPTPGRPRSVDAAVEVQVLGPITIQGTARPLTLKSMELVAYLACHPEGIHEERIKAALWPDRAPKPQTWLNRVSTTRKALGRSAGGAPLLPRFDRHEGHLDAAVQTDVDALVAARAQAAHEAATDATVTLTQALEKVRGRPFDVPTGYEWAFTELHVAHAERVVVDVAHELATLTLTLGDWRQALWATDVGLRACPASELLYQDRMRAAAAGGDRGGIDSAMRDLRRTLGATDSSNLPSRDTVELSDELHTRLQLGAPAIAPRRSARGPHPR